MPAVETGFFRAVTRLVSRIPGGRVVTYGQVARMIVATQQERLRKQLLHLPRFEVKSKLVGAKKSMAVLQFGEKSIRIRMGIEMDVPVADGVWTLMKVEQISTDFIKLTFPELERQIVLYD